MSLTGIHRRARDEFEIYYTEKLWRWIPEHYRNIDAIEPANGALRALIESYGYALAELRRESERIWENASAELADDWALSLIGGITGMPPLSTLNARARRIVVAKAVSYSRRKGTLALIAELIEDISGAEGHAVEAFRKITRMPHRLDMQDFRPTQRLGLPRTGLPDIHHPRLREISNSPLDETSHLPDFRPTKGKKGYFDLPHLHIHLVPYQSFDLQYPTVFPLDDRHFTIDPSGRDVPLFHSGQVDAKFALEAADLHEFLIPMSCERFNQAEFSIQSTDLTTLNITQLAPLQAISGLTFSSERQFLDHISDYLAPTDMDNFSAVLVQNFINSSSLKLMQLKDDIAFELDKFSIEPHEIIAATLSNWGANFVAAKWRKLAFDPRNGRITVLTDASSIPDALNLHEGRIHLVGAGAYPRTTRLLPTDPSLANTPPSHGDPVNWNIASSGALRIVDNQTYTPVIPASPFLFSGDTHWEAQDGKRPYVRFSPDASQTDIIFEGDTNNPTNLEINGVWLGIVAQNQPALPLDANGNVKPPMVRLVLDGMFDNVVLRHVTIDPGGQRASLDGVHAVPIPTVTLAIEGSVKNLDISRSICGPIVETREDPSLLNAGEIHIEDSIISAPSEHLAIKTQLSSLYMKNCTILGAIEAHRINATNTLFDGHIHVRNLANSCFRYSAFGQYLETSNPSKLPRQFECFSFESAIPSSTFASQIFGRPDFAALSEFADKNLLEGAENGAEIGVGNRNLWALRKRDLNTMINKFLPISLMAYIHQDFTGGK